MKKSRAGVDERHYAILEILGAKTVVDVPYLSTTIGVSAATIRRDLRYLESKGQLKRIYNGARLASFPLQHGLAGDQRRKEKSAVAKYAASLVERGTTIFVNSGTTTFQVIENLSDKNVTVITNNLFIVSKYLDSTSGIIAKILLTGGFLHSGDDGLIGDFAINSISSVISSQTFLGVTGISSSGITTLSPEKAFISNAMIKQCHGPKYVVTDSSKLGKETNFFTCPVTDITSVITDTLANSEEVKKIRDLGVEVILINPETGERDQ